MDSYTGQGVATCSMQLQLLSLNWFTLITYHALHKPSTVGTSMLMHKHFASVLRNKLITFWAITQWVCRTWLAMATSIHSVFTIVAPLYPPSRTILKPLHVKKVQSTSTPPIPILMFSWEPLWEDPEKMICMGMIGLILGSPNQPHTSMHHLLGF